MFPAQSNGFPQRRRESENARFSLEKMEAVSALMSGPLQCKGAFVTRQEERSPRRTVRRLHLQQPLCAGWIK